jgi:hypothetical protein
MSNEDINNVDYLRRNFQTNVEPSWESVRLPGDDYIAGGELFPGRVIAGYSANDDEYNAESWAQYVLGCTQSFSAGTACVCFSGESAPFKLGLDIVTF